MVKTFKFDESGYEVEIGKFAGQADGSVWLKQGGTIVLSTVVSAPSKEFPGFLPLTVEYREMFSAAGKIPGGYYKREGRSSEREILIARLTDRAIRPLFPEHYFDQVQIISTVYSVDKKHAPDKLALIGSSLALSISKIPFLGPIGVVEVGRVNGEWIINPMFQETLDSDVRLIIAGTAEGISMLEGSADELSEKDFVDIMFRAHEEIKKVVAWISKIQQEVGKPKQEVDEGEYDWDAWKKNAEQYITPEIAKKMFISDKIERDEEVNKVKDAFFEKYAQEIEDTGVPTKMVAFIFDGVLKEQITKLIFASNKRIDDRTFDKVRKISVEVGLLPYVHGSALFNRGRTQALVSVTLGGGQDEQRTESIMSEEEQKSGFMLHYNFPPFSVGDVRPLRGPGRREVGHGHLAKSAFKYVLPTKEEFPYTIRVVGDMLESDGSTSMATTCGTTMGLMQAGVPIKKMVSGVAMGLLRSEEGKTIILSDISGFEDAYGLMDFKVTGTENGITAIQMDIKYKGGFAKEVFVDALEQARKGRLHILGEMKKVMDKPNPELSDLVPKVSSFKINTDKIGAVIGGGGKTIREIIEVTKTSIDIEPDGLVKIFAGPEADAALAERWVKTLAGQIERGATFKGIVRRIADFGLFVELVPGLDGLLHISNIPREKQRMLASEYKVGDELPVIVAEYDDTNGRISLKIHDKK